MHVFINRSHFQNPITCLFSILYQLTFLYGLGMGRPGVKGLGQQMSRVVPVHIRLPPSVMIIINILAIVVVVIIVVIYPTGSELVGQRGDAEVHLIRRSKKTELNRCQFISDRNYTHQTFVL